MSLSLGLSKFMREKDCLSDKRPKIPSSQEKPIMGL